MLPDLPIQRRAMPLQAGRTEVVADTDPQSMSALEWREPARHGSPCRECLLLHHTARPLSGGGIGRDVHHSRVRAAWRWDAVRSADVPGAARETALDFPDRMMHCPHLCAGLTAPAKWGPQMAATKTLSASKVRAVLSRAGHQCAKSSTTRIRGWHSWSPGFRVREIGGEICVEVADFPSPERGASMAARYREALMTSGLTVTDGQHRHLIVSAGPVRQGPVPIPPVG